VVEFRDISREVSSLQIVLKAVEKAWRARDLSPIERYEVAEISAGCKEVLTDLEKNLDKYQSLGSRWKNPIDRMRWASKDIAPLRNRLISNTVLLSTFNTTLAQ